MILYAGTPDPLEWLLSALKTSWGLWLILSPHTFDVAPHLFRFVGLLPAWVWGSVMAATGQAQWWAWYYNSWRLRHRLAMWGTLLWIIWGSLVWLGDHRTGTLVFVGTLAFFQGLTAIWLFPRATSETDSGSRG